jgi:serine/threonine-protein kinase
LLAEPAAARCESAFEARRLLERLPWSSRPLVRVPPEPRVAAALEDPGERLELLPSIDERIAVARDRWLDRTVWTLPLEPAELARAAAMARAAVLLLPTVLRADARSGRLWVAAPRGEPLTALPSAAEHTALRAAVLALHAAGAAHGAIDLAHLYRDAGELRLAYPRSAPPARPEDDLAALDRLR